MIQHSTLGKAHGWNVELCIWPRACIDLALQNTYPERHPTVFASHHMQRGGTRNQALSSINELSLSAEVVALETAILGPPAPSHSLVMYSHSGYEPVSLYLWYNLRLM
jgi:hypothetical protein